MMYDGGIFSPNVNDGLPLAMWFGPEFYPASTICCSVVFKQPEMSDFIAMF